MGFEIFIDHETNGIIMDEAEKKPLSNLERNERPSGMGLASLFSKRRWEQA